MCQRFILKASESVNWSRTLNEYVNYKFSLARTFEFTVNLCIFVRLLVVPKSLASSLSFIRVFIMLSKFTVLILFVSSGLAISVRMFPMVE